jgi:hypothetical protein
VGISVGFGVIGGGVGMKLSGMREVFVGIGLGLAEGGVSIATGKLFNQSARYIYKANRLAYLY